ncbi:unnamed protein product [Moneuplotes crassus]|uniref:Uncharacterized protein n=1 Tax=Euplotes crassus TaxID=5936 RepID=A0AAD2CXK8_EUPCR|nr:unnamed protein product [Moneuplotes crassus]
MSILPSYSPHNGEKILLEVYGDVTEEEVQQMKDYENKTKIKHKDFRDTYYMKSFDSTARYPSIQNVLDDLKCIYSKSYIDDLYEKHKESSVKVITSIWTGDTKLTKLINAALIVDSGITFNKSLCDKNFKFMSEIVAKSGKSYKLIIDKSIKFMRILNSYIVDKGREFNTEDRVVYRGISTEIFRNVELEKPFRIVNWSCCSESLYVAKTFANFHSSLTGKVNTIVRFNIKSGCYNAGKLSQIGISCYVQEKETLFPPYTVAVLKKKIKLDTKTLDSIISYSCSSGRWDEESTFSYCFTREETNSNIDFTHLLEVDISFDNKSSKLDNADACYF